MNKTAFGNFGENLAVSFLENKGYTIIKRNHRTKFAEIDIIAKDKKGIVFIEVKTRSSDIFGSPQEAVNRTKIKKIEKAASLYIENEKISSPVRFEILSVMGNSNPWKFEIIPME